jgi:hypothetical protein
LQDQGRHYGDRLGFPDDLQALRQRERAMFIQAGEQADPIAKRNAMTLAPEQIPGVL